MRMPSAKQRKSLERATARYQTTLTQAAGYLEQRGISLAMAEAARLGVCSEPEVGHEASLGRLSIPYINKAGVIGIKFRCMQTHICKEHNCPKYLAPLGQDIYLYNILAVEADASTIHITEGELDALVLAHVLSEPAVGVPGASSWKGHHPWHFRGFERVLVWADGDKAGQDLARLLRKEISAAEIVTMPDRHDVNSLYATQGPEALRKLAGEDDE